MSPHYAIYCLPVRSEYSPQSPPTYVFPFTFYSFQDFMVTNVIICQYCSTEAYICFERDVEIEFYGTLLILSEQVL